MDDTIAYKCPCCGASLVWGSKEQELVCEYCDNKFTEAQLKEIADEENTKAQEMNAKWNVEETDDDNGMDGIKVHICQSCGGEKMCIRDRFNTDGRTEIYKHAYTCTGIFCKYYLYIVVDDTWMSQCYYV